MPEIACLDDYRWLAGPEGATRLESTELAPEAGLLQLIERLRADLSASRAHLVVEQLELRRRARDKFSHPERMLFTRRLLEQATDEVVADYKARRFAAGQPIADLCCGLGGDLLGLAQRGPVVAVDRDPVATLLAEVNARALGNDASNVSTRTRDVADFPLSDVTAWHIDPDRRPSGKRTTRAALHEPGPEIVRRLLNAQPEAAVKLAPAAVLAEPWWNEGELEWIGRRRRCRQLVAWFGKMAHEPGRRRATVLRGLPGEQPVVAATFVGEPNLAPPAASKIGRYVFEPDPAVLAARLEGALGLACNVFPISPNAAYFTGDELFDHGTWSAFEVLEVIPFRLKAVQRWLAAREIGSVEVKKRGVDIDPHELARQLAGNGDGQATVLLARIGRRVSAIVARRVGETSASA